jgi:LysM repeat protein
LNLNRTIENRIDRFVVKEQFVLPSAKPNVREVLQVSAGITNQEIRISNGRVNLSGEISMTTLYRGNTDDSLIEFIESELPFNGPIDISGARDDMFADATLQILDHHISVRPDDDGEDRVLDVEISVGVEMKVYSTETFPILEDAYIINTQLSLTKTAVRYPRLVCLNRNQTPVKEVVTLGAGVPDMLQIFRVKGHPHIDDLKIIDDKIIVEGAINTDILYVAENDSTPLASFRTVIPYRQVIEAKGANSTMSVDMDISVDHVTFNMQTPRETEVRFLLTFNARVVEQEETRIIRDIEFTEIDPAQLASQASMTVYIVQNGDNLWKIAKRYNTPLDELLAVNEIEHPGKISQGQKLLILKRGM